MSELAQYLELIYGTDDGFVYAATKEADGTFGQTNFHWPNQQDALIRHIQEKSAGAEVYVCPSLFNNASGQRSEVAGSRTVWADFDGTTISSWGTIPEPDIVIETSADHFHCYWILAAFHPPELIEAINRKIAYNFEADLSGWDANQLLRPPGTLNHKRDGYAVHTLRARIGSRDPDEFGKAPEPPPLIDPGSFGTIPAVEDVIAKYSWPDELWKKFKAGAEKPNRSTALAALGYKFAEMGMQNEEMLALLLNAANRMGKFDKRPDALKRLVDLISRIRIKVPFLGEDDELLDSKGYTLTALTSLVAKIDWICKPYIHGTGLIIATGPPGIGKSQLSLSLQQSLGLGTEWLENEVSRPMKVGFLSLEMPIEEVQLFVQSQLQVYDSGQRSLLDENVVIFPLGVPINLGEGHAQNYVMRLVEENNLDGLIIDSLSSCTPNELSSDKESKALLNFDVYLRKKYGIFTTYVHHNRKAQSDNKKPNKLSDVFGSGMMIIRPSTIFTLWSESTGRIEFKPLKTRLGALPEAFHISRTQNLHFTRKSPAEGLTITGGGEVKAKVEVEKQEKDEEGGKYASPGGFDLT